MNSIYYLVVAAIKQFQRRYPQYTDDCQLLLQAAPGRISNIKRTRWKSLMRTSPLLYQVIAEYYEPGEEYDQWLVRWRCIVMIDSCTRDLKNEFSGLLQ